MIYYVTMTDVFMTWWIKADDGRTVKLIFTCYSSLAADIIVNNAARRGDMLQIHKSKGNPEFDDDKYKVTYVNHNDYPRWFYKNSLVTKR